MVKPKAVIVRQGQGRAFAFPMGNRGEVKADSSAGMDLGFFRADLPLGAGMPFLHVHAHTDEAFYIVKGSVEYRLGDDYVTAKEGDGVLVPRGVAHCFRSVTEEGAAVVVLVTPANGVDMILEMSETAGIDPRAYAEILGRYDTEMLEMHPHWAMPALSES